MLTFVCRLMVNLTQPALLCFGKTPNDAVFRHHFLQVVTYLQGYKEVNIISVKSLNALVDYIKVLIFIHLFASRHLPTRKCLQSWVRRCTTCCNWWVLLNRTQFVHSVLASCRTKPSENHPYRICIEWMQEFGLLVEKSRPVPGFECTRGKTSIFNLINLISFLHFFVLFYQDWEQRQEEDNLLIERILLLVRNVLHVPADPTEEKVRVNVL